jgi:hypothetical protein
MESFTAIVRGNFPIILHSRRSRGAARPSLDQEAPPA